MVTSQVPEQTACPRCLYQVMDSLRGWLVLSFLLSPVAMGQQAQRIARIIETPPTLKVLKMVRPTFPADARAKDIFGTVAVEAQIDKTGKPSSVKALRGDPVLAAAVVEAVRKWRWEPLKLNGAAVEAVTTITVNFEPR
jgi:TonB family protein